MSRKKLKFLSTRLALLLLFVVFVSLALPTAAWFYAQRKQSQRLSQLDRRLEALGELVTVTQVYRSVFYTREKKNFIQDKSLLFTAEFTVKAGVDLSRGYELRRGKDGLRLLLPPGEIFTVDGDDGSFKQIFVRERFSSINTGDYLPLIGGEGETIRQMAEDGGITQSAEERAVLLLGGILRSAGVESPVIEFRKEGLQ